jgi:UDP-N-acetylmuramate--alanine ligase
MQDVKRTFGEFMDRVPFYGMIVACNDDPVLRRMLPQVHRRVVTYGTRRGSDFAIKLQPCTPSEHGAPLSRFEITFENKPLEQFELHVPGTHNVLNATAAIAVGIGLDVSPENIRVALANFRGVDRRFQLRGKAAGVSVIDDYGHHPTEIRVTLAAARQCGFGKIHVIFQPHRFTRTRDLMDDFATAFADCDSLSVLDIYAANEEPIDGISAPNLVAKLHAAGKDAAYSPSFAEAVDQAVSAAKPGDMILTLGAGNVSQLGPLLVEKLGLRAPAQFHASSPV